MSTPHAPVQLVLRLGAEDHEEDDQPAETFAALVEFGFDSEVVDDEHLEVLIICDKEQGPAA